MITTEIETSECSIEITSMGNMSAICHKDKDSVIINYWHTQYCILAANLRIVGLRMSRDDTDRSVCENDLFSSILIYLLTITIVCRTTENTGRSACKLIIFLFYIYGIQTE